MFAAVFLTTFPTFITLIGGWLFGVVTIATLFMLRHRRIRMHEQEHEQ